MIPAEMRERLLEAFDKSSMSGTEFAAYYNLKYQTFATWRQKRDRERLKENGEPEKPTFVELTLPVIETSKVNGKLKIDLPGGASIQITTPEEAQLAAELLKAFGGSSC
jgi:hypothetical protein